MRGELPPVKGLPRTFELEEILTEEQIALAAKLYKKSKRGFYAACADQIVAPAWDRITEVLGPCETRFIVYGIEFHVAKKRRKRSVPRSKFEASMYGKRRSGRRPKQDKEVDRSRWSEKLHAVTDVIFG